ncbi:SDR family NAD(P)-dependent oxidoreductase [Phenylobacterium sp. LjRoot219]|uniref:SDR family NAD(P)-dependent oxidoreductase n=1 Tax=Phenylobacterium sp. LjRoot219 TaxID=3342283 RepID=UPI003ECE93F5
MFAGRFSGRCAVITGGASGAGKAVAQRLAKEGARVVLWDLNPQALVEAAAEVGAAHTCAVDVSDPAAVAAAAEDTRKALGSVDLLLCSAGITGPTAPVVDFPLEGWRRVIEVNLNGVFYACRALAPYMIANGYGRIVNLASIAAKDPNPNASAYGAAKAGVVGFTKGFAKELAKTGVLVNAVTPAVFVTPLLEQMPESQIEMMKSKIPMGRFGELDEVVSMICWLLSDECSFSTGATFDISGGRATY